MISIFLAIHVLLSLTIIGLIMLQRGKGADAGAALGGGGGGGGGGASGAVFGARGAANFLSRTTAILAAAFFATSLTLAYLSANQGSTSSIENISVTDKVIGQPADLPAADDMPMAPADDIPASE